MWRTQNAPIEHTRQHNIIGIQSAAGYFVVGINLGTRRTNDSVSFFAHTTPSLLAMRGEVSSGRAATLTLSGFKYRFFANIHGKWPRPRRGGGGEGLGGDPCGRPRGLPPQDEGRPQGSPLHIPPSPAPTGTM